MARIPKLGNLGSLEIDFEAKINTVIFCFIVGNGPEEAAMTLANLGLKDPAEDNMGWIQNRGKSDTLQRKSKPKGKTKRIAMETAMERQQVTVAEKRVEGLSLLPRGQRFTPMEWN